MIVQVVALMVLHAREHGGEAVVALARRNVDWVVPCAAEHRQRRERWVGGGEGR